MENTGMDERRKSFRVSMTAFTALTNKIDSAADPSDCFPELHALSLLSQNDVIEQELNSVAEKIKDLAVRKSMDLLRQKLALIAKLIDVKAAQANSMTTTNVDISEGGCSFVSDEQYQVGDRIALALIFTPSYFALFVFGSVTNISKTEDSESRLHITFDTLSETQRQNLLKNMFKAQTQHT